jgi:hypothetical protein
MQYIKSSIFLYLTPRQKTQLLGTLKSYFKKFPNLSIIELDDKFLEDENYYLEINNPHFEFVKEYLDNDEFYRDMKKYFSFCELEKKQKEQMKDLIEAQKQKEKLIRKKAQDYKMSKLKPTKKQLFYYEKITKAHNKQMRDTTNASRLDLRNWIMEILDEFDI